MKFISEIIWDEVFAIWRNCEGSNSAWVNCATKVKGWDSWEEWRSFTAEQFDFKNRQWKLFQFEKPEKEIPQMLVGPYSSWQEKCSIKNQTTFEELLNNIENLKHFSQDLGVLNIIKGLPFDTEFIGFIRKDIDKIVCVEGHHRATAITFSQKFGKKVDFSNVSLKIALTELQENEIDLLQKVLKRGTAKFF